MRQMTLTLPDKMYQRLASLARAENRTPEQLAYERLRREVGDRRITSPKAKAIAKRFVQQRAGRCLDVRDPVLENGSEPVWLVPVVTNVLPSEAAFVGEVVINAQSGVLLTTEGEVVAMMKRGHPSFGFRSFPLDKSVRLSELLDRHQEALLSNKEQDELERLVAEQLDLEVTNLEELNRRLLPEN